MNVCCLAFLQDLTIQAGRLNLCEFPAILGHEGAGYIRALGAGVRDPSLRIGDFVLLSFNTCGVCKQCRRGHPSYCHGGPRLHMNAVRVEDGSSPARLKGDGRSVRSQFFGQSSFAKMSVVKESCVVKFEGDAEGAGIFAACGCGFQTGAGTVLNVLKPREDDVVAVFGMGSVGLAALMAAKAVGVRRLVAVDVNAERLELARELGATEVVNSRETPGFVEEILRLTEGEGADFALDCAGADMTADPGWMVSCADMLRR